MAIPGVKGEGAAGAVPAEPHAPSCQRNCGCRAAAPQPVQGQFPFPQLGQAPEGQGMETQLIPHWFLILHSLALGKALSKFHVFTASSVEQSEMSIVDHKNHQDVLIWGFLGFVWHLNKVWHKIWSAQWELNLSLTVKNHPGSGHFSAMLCPSLSICSFFWMVDLWGSGLLKESTWITWQGCRASVSSSFHSTKLQTNHQI